jgi:drug/metabolite transporter (DMT)-like permease
MSLFAIAIILIAAVFHATWNLLAKRAQGGAAFVWLYQVLASACLIPIVFLLILFTHATFTLWSFVFMIGSGLLEVLYFLFLQRGYRVGDLSLVYPLARGTGPLLSTIFAILIFQERPTPLALCGAACIIGGVVFIAWRPQHLSNQRSRQALFYGCLTGCCIASYTLWDKQALTVGHLAPLVLYYGIVSTIALALTPFALRHWPEVSFHWRTHRLEAIGIAILSALSYVLILFALVFTPVSYIAPAREISVLFGALLGTKLLAEGDTRRRLLAAGIIVVGIVALAL